MKTVQLLKNKVKALQPGLFPCVMLVLLTTRTFISGKAIMLTGLCVAFLPFFSQNRSLTCFAEDVSEEKEIMVSYLLHWLFIGGGLLYLYGVTSLGSMFYDGYVVNPYLGETFLLVATCDMVFISLMIPLTYSLNATQRMMVAAILANIEIAFMALAMKLLSFMGADFIAMTQWGLYLLLLLVPLTAIEFVALNGLQKKRAAMTGRN